MPTPDIRCTNCRKPYPDEGLPYCCPSCGGVYDHASLWAFDETKIDDTQPGIWRYRDTFGIGENVEAVSLGEGNTPLLWKKVLRRKVAFKCEYQNPTGSFKDRGSAVIAGWLRARGIGEVVEDSSGNAGASMAAYASRGGMRARIFIPESTSGPKRRQIETAGAEVVPIPGPRSKAAEAVRLEAEGGVVYASHAYLPFNLPGYATAAYEIHEQLGKRMPGSVIVPAGQGGLLLGMRRGFDALRIANISSGNTDNNNEDPIIVGVQARACAPLWALLAAGPQGMGFVTENQTLAEGVKVRYPVRGDEVIRAVTRHNPEVEKSELQTILAVDEEEIMPGRKELARLGLLVEPTSAIVWSALKQVIHQLPDPIVVILTGAGYKYG